MAIAQTGGYPASPSHAVTGAAPDGTPRYGLIDEASRVPGDPNARSLTMKVSSAATIRNQAFTQSMETIRRRIDALGVTEPTIAEYGQGDYEMVIELPDVGDPTQVKDIIQTTAMLELKLVQDGPYSSRRSRCPTCMPASGRTLGVSRDGAGLARKGLNRKTLDTPKRAALESRLLPGRPILGEKV